MIKILRITSKMGINAFYFSLIDKPKPPRDLEIFDVFAEHCNLKWKAPEDDGGTPITGKHI